MYRRAIVLLLALAPIGVLIFRDAPHEDVVFLLGSQLSYHRDTTPPPASTAQTLVEAERDERPTTTSTTVTTTTATRNTDAEADIDGAIEELTSEAEGSAPTKVEESSPPDLVTPTSTTLYPDSPNCVVGDLIGLGVMRANRDEVRALTTLTSCPRWTITDCVDDALSPQSFLVIDQDPAPGLVVSKTDTVVRVVVAWSRDLRPWLNECD